ncbi:hypothetical protein N8381_03620, partial [Oceanospirillaceae bacterium]|nr:hypothetical protein [Oceanospirillaceae bacterium]
MAGLNVAKYDVICNVDDDNHLNPYYLSKLFQIYNNNPSIDMCGGMGIAITNKSDGLPSYFKDFSDCYAVGAPAAQTGFLNRKTDFLYGAGFSYKKNKLQVIIKAGFKFQLIGREGRNLLSGEDMEMYL